MEGVSLKSLVRAGREPPSNLDATARDSPILDVHGQLPSVVDLRHPDRHVHHRQPLPGAAR
jgi:hypothetical protein